MYTPSGYSLDVTSAQWHVQTNQDAPRIKQMRATNGIRPTQRSHMQARVLAEPDTRPRHLLTAHVPRPRAWHDRARVYHARVRARDAAGNSARLNSSMVKQNSWPQAMLAQTLCWRVFCACDTDVGRGFHFNVDRGYAPANIQVFDQVAHPNQKSIRVWTLLHSGFGHVPRVLDLTRLCPFSHTMSSELLEILEFLQLYPSSI